MITQEIVVEKILAHLNGEITELELVHWAEDALLELTESDDEVPNEKNIIDVLMYVGAGDSPGFPLTWEVIKEFLERLGRPVQKVVA